MNIHPLFVHFPIALLVAYSVIEIAAYVLPALRRQAWVFPVKTFLLFAGVLAALLTLVTGDMAEELLQSTNPRSFILEVHAPFAVATTILYFILASAYLIRVFDIRGWGSRVVGTSSFLARIWSIKKYIAYFILDNWLLPLLALVALVDLCITGALGAAVVYGPTTDPFVSFVYHLFFAQ